MQVRRACAASGCGMRVLQREGTASGCCCERVRWRAGAAGEYGGDRAVLPGPPPLSPAPGVRVPLRREGAACGCGERARRRAGAAASGCCMRVRRERVRRVRNSPSKAWNSFWHFSLQLPKHVVLPFLMSACVSKRTRRCMTPVQGGGVHHYIGNLGEGRDAHN